MKSIQLKLLVIFTSIIIVLNTSVGALTRTLVLDKLLQDTSGHLVSMAQQESKYIGASLEADLKYVSALAQNQVISESESTLEDQVTFFEAEAKRAGFVLFGYADRTGKAVILNSSKEKNDVADREFFKEALKGNPASSDLMFSKLDGKPVIVFAAPVYENGNIKGVLYGRKDGLLLSEIISKLNYKNTGYAYMINNQGTTVAHKNTDLVLAQDNDIENMKDDASLTELGNLTKKMTEGTVGDGEYVYNGISKIVGYAPVENTPWTVVFGVEKSEILSEIKGIQKSLLIVFILTGAAGALVTFFASRSISRLIKRVTSAAKEIADGNFDVILSIKAKDEVGQLADAFNATLNRLKNYQGYIDEISDSLLQIGNGNLQVSLQREYVGQFRRIKENLETLVNGLSETLLQIHQASEQVDSGAGQVANGAQALSQGATEQASSVEELSASLFEVTQQVKQNAEDAKQARDKATETGAELTRSNEQMQDMMEAMKDITEKATEISKIIKIIDDIAFQTNILALNAAVEAARAGASGKGFAVVAQEVRNLAAKSAEAAKSTSLLISETVESVNNGVLIVDKTALSLDKGSQEALVSAELIDKIAEASENQASAIIQINQGIEQISSVVQTNAATAEESAAASEELSSQANMLKELISRFDLGGNA